MFHDTKKWYKIWLAVWKMTWGIGTLMWSCYPKQKIIELKINRGVMYHDNEEWCKIWRGFGLSYQNWHHNLTNFDPSTPISQKFALQWLLLNKVYNVWANKVQKKYVWWHWRLMQNLRKNWLVLPIMTWGIWQIFTVSKIAISF